MLDKWRPFNKRNHGKDKYIEEALAIFEDCAIKRRFAIEAHPINSGERKYYA
ncbi:hypothetical protein [uncultured Prevotella sp.]|uniref:hypothetical protein n=1 Tax=uncultured Prevotella sp. TaxID=159272 RepID=UPI00265D3CD6|nr:hypothetical protein [uncultured Prevotella sp.]